MVAAALIDCQVLAKPFLHAREAVLKFQRSWLCGSAGAAS